MNNLGWKRPIRSWSPTINLTLSSPPLNHVPKHHVYSLLNTSRDGDSTTSLHIHCMLILINRLHEHPMLTRWVSSECVDKYILTTKILTFSDFRPRFVLA